MNKRADSLAAQIAARLREISPKERADYGPVVVQLLEKAAKKLDDSQDAWHTYQDQYCTAISYSYTTGSGSGEAMEECLYTTASNRVRELLRNFSGSVGSKGHDS